MASKQLTAKSADSSWLPIFEEFIADVRIDTKEESPPDGSGVEFELWESQRRFLYEVAIGLDNGVKHFRCLKSRQLGCSTIVMLIFLFWAAVHPGMAIAVVAEKEGNIVKIRKEITQIMERLLAAGYFGEDFYIVKSNRTEIQFSNNARFDFKVAGTKTKSTAWGEGAGYAAAWMTEVASYGSAEGLSSFMESFAQMNPHSLFIMESTGKGINNVWYDVWKAGETDPITIRSFFIGWWSAGNNRIPKKDGRFAIYGLEPPNDEEAELIDQVKKDYDFEVDAEQLAWYRWRDDTNTAGEIMVQNHPWTAKQAFVETGQSFFQTRIISQDMHFLASHPEDYGYLAYKYNYGNTFFDMEIVLLEEDSDPSEIELKIWEEPVEGGRYVIGCDPAYGRNDHKDNIAISIWRCYADKLVQVAEYATYQVDVRFAGWALAHLAGSYKECIVNLEIEGGGRVIMNDWDNLRQMINNEVALGEKRGETWEDALSMARWYLYRRVDTMGAGYAYNFSTTWRTKQELMYGIRSSYITRELLIRSMSMLREMAIVRQDGTDIGAPESRDPNCKDDRVFAAAFAHRAWQNWVKPEMMTLGLTYQVLDDEEKGRASKAARIMNSVVTHFWQDLAYQAQQQQEKPSWREDLGLE